MDEIILKEGDKLRQAGFVYPLLLYVQQPFSNNESLKHKELSF